MKYQWLKVAAVVASMGAFSAQAAENNFKIGLGYDVGFSVLAQVNNNINIAVGDGGLAADYLFMNGEFEGEVPFTWFIGGGGTFSWNSNNFGVRVPLGLDWNFAENWDAFAFAAPSLDFGNGVDLNFGASIGVRYAF